MTLTERDQLQRHISYCIEQAKRREAEGRYEVARRWRLEASDTEARIQRGLMQQSQQLRPA